MGLGWGLIFLGGMPESQGNEIQEFLAESEDKHDWKTAETSAECH